LAILISVLGSVDDVDDDWLMGFTNFKSSDATD
jgi:hypothetical protein